MPGRLAFCLEIVTTRRARRVNELRTLLSRDGAVPVSRLLAALDCSLATFKRDLDFLRTVKKVPVVWDAVNRGYRLAATHEYNMSTVVVEP